MRNTKIFAILLGTTFIFNVCTTNIFKTNVIASVNNLTVSINKGVIQFKELTPITVDKDKVFTITFNKEINKSSINSNTVKVFDSKGQEVSVTVVTRTDNNKIAIVRPVSSGYIEGETYTLIVKQGVQDINKLPLEEDVTMKFTIKSTVIVVPPVVTLSADESYFKSIQGTGAWSGNFEKVVGDKLYFNYYDYIAKKYVPHTSLSTTYNPNINRQTIDVFKSLYIEKTGYRTEIMYGKGEDNSGLVEVRLYGKDIELRGDSFGNFTFYTSTNATIMSKNVYASMGIPQCTLAQFDKSKGLLKKPLRVVVGEKYTDTIYAYLLNQYKQSVLDNPSAIGVNNNINYTKIIGNFKIIIWSNGKRFVAEFVKI